MSEIATLPTTDTAMIAAPPQLGTVEELLAAFAQQVGAIHETGTAIANTAILLRLRCAMDADTWVGDRIA